MARRLSDTDIAAICDILDGWRGALTWQGLVEAVEQRFGHLYSRQALNMHERIKRAFTLRKVALRAEPEPVQASSPNARAALDRISRLEAENSRLNAENNQLLEQFVRWAYNASLRGLDHRFLNQPLPEVDRERSKLPGARPKG